MYQGQTIRVALRHVRHGNVAGNNAFHIAGPLLDGHSLEFYDRDTVTRVTGNRPESRVFIDGNEVLDTPGGQNRFDAACQFFLDRHLVCQCGWNGKELNFMINDRTLFKFDRWTTGGRGWNNAYLQINPADKDANDIGMCTYGALSNDYTAAGKPQDDPYPNARLDCSD